MSWHDLNVYFFRLFKSRTEWRREAEAQSRFSTEVYGILRWGGWFPGRSEQVPDSILWHRPAASIMAEFGGLTFAGKGADYSAGLETIRATVSIDEPYFDEEMRGYGLCEIGTHSCTAAMYVDMDGFVYHDDAWHVGKTRIDPLARSIDRALECLLSGLKPRDEDVRDHKLISIMR